MRTVFISWGHNKVAQAGWLKQQEFIFSHNCGGWKPKIKVLAGLVACVVSLPLACEWHPSLLPAVISAHSASCGLFVHVGSCGLRCIRVSSFSKDIGQVGLGPTLRPHLNLIISLETCLQIQSLSEVLGVMASTCKFGVWGGDGHNSAHISKILTLF